MPVTSCTRIIVSLVHTGRGARIEGRSAETPEKGGTTFPGLNSSYSHTETRTQCGAPRAARDCMRTTTRTGTRAALERVAPVVAGGGASGLEFVDATPH